ncbi:MAG: hypothetical protein JSV84_05960 [Gemmatimonadota bacterium]|nr:MAG: hypothetical protein JSV84_05960 [Gemmatimonadota bacterium]
MSGCRTLRKSSYLVSITLGCLVLSLSLSIAGINEWTSIGPPGLWSSAIAIDPQNPDIVYVGSAYNQEGIYKTTDGGIHWQKINIKYGGVKCIVINPLDTDVLYAGTSRGGVHKSTDGGESWVITNWGLPRGAIGDYMVQSFAVDPKDPERLYAGRDLFGLYRSIDGGGHWEPTDVQKAYVRDIAVDPVNSNIIYSGTDYSDEWTVLCGVLKSTDGGDSWRKMNEGISGQSVISILDIAIDPHNPEKLYIATAASGGGYNSVYKSTDGGESWQNTNNNMNAIFTRSIVLNPTNPNILYAANEPLSNILFGSMYKSTDGGGSWTSIEEGLTTHVLQEIAIKPVDPEILYLGTWCGGIFKTTNGGENWDDITDGTMKANLVRHIAIDPSNPSIIFASASVGLLKTIDRGITWIRLQEGLPKYFYPKSMAFDPRDSHRIYLGSSHEGLFLSEDGGQSWMNSGDGLEDPGRIYTIVISPHNPDMVYVGTSEGIFRSSDGGQTWDRPPNDFTDQKVNDLIFHPEDSNVLYVAGDRGIYKSIDSGLNWEEKMTGLFGYNYHITMDSHDPNVLYVNNSNNGPAGGVFKSTDGGESWLFKDQGLENINNWGRRRMNVLIIDPEDSNVLYCSDSGNGSEFTGIYMSTDGGDSWTSIRTDFMVDNVVYDLKIDPENHNTIYAATKGNSIVTYTRADSNFVLMMDDQVVLQNSKDNRIYLELQNCSDICHLQADILYDTTCFQITSVEQTARARVTSMFFHSVIEGGIQIIQSSISGCIDVGEGSVVEILFDTGSCLEGYYPWNITNTVLGDPLGREISPLCKDGTVAILSGPKGDINSDGAVNALDVVLTIRIAIGSYPNPTEDEIRAADCNIDGVINVTDVLGIVNLILGLKHCPP